MLNTLQIMRLGNSEPACISLSFSLSLYISLSLSLSLYIYIWLLPGALELSEGLSEVPLGAAGVLKPASSRMWRSNLMFRLARNRLWRSNSLLGPAWRCPWRSTSLRSRCSKSLSSVTLRAVPLHAVLNCSVHGYARVRID